MNRFSFDSFPATDPANIIYCGELRISVLTDRLIRLEKGKFTDEATQTVWNRDFPPVPFTAVEKDGCMLIAYCRGGEKDENCLARLGMSKINLDNINEHMLE